MVLINLKKNKEVKKTREQVINEINALFADNNTKNINPLVLRTGILSIIESSLFSIDDVLDDLGDSSIKTINQLKLTQELNSKVSEEEFVNTVTTLATKNEVRDAVVGTNLLEPKANITEIKAITTPEKGDTHKANDTGHYWKYDDIITGINPYNPNKWIDIGIIIPSDTMLSGGTNKTGQQLDKEKLNISNYQENEITFSRFPVIQNIVLGIVYNWNNGGKETSTTYDTVVLPVKYGLKYYYENCVPFRCVEFSGIPGSGTYIASKDFNDYTPSSNLVKYISLSFKKTYNASYTNAVVYSEKSYMDYSNTTKNFSSINTSLNIIDKDLYNFTQAETKLDTILSSYVDINGAIVAGSATRYINVYKIEDSKERLIKGEMAGSGASIYGIYNSYDSSTKTLSGLVSKGQAAGTHININKYISFSVGTYYLAVCCLADYGDVSVLSLNHDSSKLDVLESIEKEMYVSDYSEKTTLNSKLTSKYISITGVLTSGADTRFINVYAVENGKNYKVIGKASGAGVAAVSLYKDAALTELIQVLDLAGTTTSFDKIYSLSMSVSNAFMALCGFSVYPIDLYNEKEITRFSKIEEEIEDIRDVITDDTIMEIGDSMATGISQKPDGSTIAIPITKFIQDEFNISCLNYGVGGENSTVITGRFGSIPLMVKPFTIPTDLTKTYIQIVDKDGTSQFPLQQGGIDSINPCYIEGVKGNITFERGSVPDPGDGSGGIDNQTVFWFQRLAIGEAKVINKISPITTYLFHSNTSRNTIPIIWMGTNDGVTSANYVQKTKDLITRIRSMIESLNPIQKQFIVIGTHQPSIADKSVYEGIESMMYQEFGYRYINIRKYLIENGLKDCGLTPNTRDLELIDLGVVPVSLRWNELTNHLIYDANVNVAKKLVIPRLQHFGILPYK